jgi:hypothetical protein
MQPLGCFNNNIIGLVKNRKRTGSPSGKDEYEICVILFLEMENEKQIDV